MAISRITTWADGQVLTAADLNAEFNNILNNALNLISPLTGNLNFNNNQATNLRLENATGVSASTQLGRVWYDTALGQIITPSTLSGVSAGLIVGPNTGIGRVQGLTGSIVSNIGSFAAASYQMYNPTFKFTVGVTATSSFSINTQTAGPIVGGRDQAAAFSSTDVHFYAITTGVGSTSIAGVCSSNPPPTGPAAFQDAWVYLCSAKYSTGSSGVTMTSYLVQGSKVKAFESFAAVLSITSSADGTVGTNISPWIPRTATQIDFALNLGGIASTDGRLEVTQGIFTSTAEGYGYFTNTVIKSTTVSGFQHQTGQHITLPVVQTTPMVYPINHGITTSVGTPLLTISWNGYTVPNGDQ